MMLTQFQDEPAPVPAGAERLRDELINATDVAEPSELSALALGLSLRDNLTDEERDYLDRLAPPGALTFIVHDGRYLHPDGVELFPLEVIDAAVNLGGSAIFSHHYRPEAGDGNAFEIHTALIHRDEGGKTVLGMFRPENMLERDKLRNEFADLALRFRRAVGAVSPVSRRLAEILLKCDAPAFVIDRFSGRVLTANKAAAETLNCDASDLVGLDSTGLNLLVARVVAVRRTAMQNIAQAGLELSVITFFPTSRPDSETAPELPAAIGESRGDLSRTIRATIAPDDENTDHIARQPVELSREITRQADIAAGLLTSSLQAGTLTAKQYESADFDYER